MAAPLRITMFVLAATLVMAAGLAAPAAADFGHCRLGLLSRLRAYQEYGLGLIVYDGGVVAAFKRWAIQPRQRD